MLNINNIKKYILVLPTNQDRVNNAYYIKNTYFNDIEIKYVINSKFDEYAFNAIQQLPPFETNTWDDLLPHFHDNKIREYSCAYEHYRIIKEAYLLGYENILVLEDDVIVKDINLINEFLAHAPEEFDLLKIGYWNGDLKTCNDLPINNDLYEKENIYWIESNKMQRYGTMANIYSRTGMKKYIDYQDEHVCLADVWTYELNADKKYITSIPLFDLMKIKSSIG